MKRYTKKISWLDMLKKFESLGYYYTADYKFLPPGYKRKQLIFRFDFIGGNDKKRLTLQEVETAFNGEIFIREGRMKYAPEIKSFFATNKIYNLTNQ